MEPALPPLRARGGLRGHAAAAVIENGSSTMLNVQWEVSRFAISVMGAFSHR